MDLFQERKIKRWSYVDCTTITQEALALYVVPVQFGPEFTLGHTTLDSGQLTLGTCRGENCLTYE